MEIQYIVEGMVMALVVAGVLIFLIIPLTLLFMFVIYILIPDSPSKKPSTTDAEKGYAKFTPDGCAYLDLKDPRTLAKLKEMIEDFNKPKSLDDFNLPEDIKRDIKRHRYTREEINANWEKTKKMIEEKRIIEEEMIGK